jgi:hypothetical protein
MQARSALLLYGSVAGTYAWRVIDDAGYPRFASRGRTFVYVLPCRDEDLLKVGFSRDPLQRLRTLHPRFHQFFDLERGRLIETDHLRDARRIERRLITTFAAHRAPAPLVIPQAAAGYTEWHRGVYPQVTELCERMCIEEGLSLYGLHQWLRARFEERSDALFDWSSRLLEAIDYARFNPPADSCAGQTDQARMEQALGRVLGVCTSLGLDVQALVEPAVFAWFEQRQALLFR